MASLISSCPTPKPTPSLSKLNKLAPKLTTYLSSPSSSQTHQSFKLSALGGDFLGDFGARDPFPAEIESNFGDKVIGCFGTEHKILIPNLSVISLAQRSCESISPSRPPLSLEDAGLLLKKVLGWRLVETNGEIKLECLWKVRDYGCGGELINRISRALENVGHYPNLHLLQPNHVRAELWTSSIGGLSLNDFIVAAKIDEIKASDLLPKKRAWA